MLVVIVTATAFVIVVAAGVLVQLKEISISRRWRNEVVVQFTAEVLIVVTAAWVTESELVLKPALAAAAAVVVVPLVEVVVIVDV